MHQDANLSIFSYLLIICGYTYRIRHCNIPFKRIIYPFRKDAQNRLTKSLKKRLHYFSLCPFALSLHINKTNYNGILQFLLKREKRDFR